MFGIKLKLIEGRFELTHFRDLMTYLQTLKRKVVMIGIKLKLMRVGLS